MKVEHKVEKINMEGLKPPYFMLSNHEYFIDFELAALGTFPHRVNNVINIEPFLYWKLNFVVIFVDS